MHAEEERAYLWWLVALNKIIRVNPPMAVIPESNYLVIASHDEETQKLLFGYAFSVIGF